jgi:hypothetical protein
MTLKSQCNAPSSLYQRHAVGHCEVKFRQVEVDCFEYSTEGKIRAVIDAHLTVSTPRLYCKIHRIYSVQLHNHCLF